MDGLNSLKRRQFQTPLSIPERCSGKFKVEHKWYDAKETIPVIGARDRLFTGKPILNVAFDIPIRYHFLKDKDGTWMADVPVEQAQQIEHIKKMHGHILIGGLGLGLFATMAAQQKKVKSLTVIENSRDVRKLVWHFLNLNGKSNRIITADLWQFLKIKHKGFDSAYFDIWRPDGERAFVDYVVKLKRLGQKSLGIPAKQIYCWQEDVMVGQFIQGLQSQIQISFNKMKQMSIKKFEDFAADKFLQIAGIFWRVVRERNVSQVIALKMLPNFRQWLLAGMQGKFETLKT